MANHSKRPKRTFTQKFKNEVVELVQNSGRTQKSIAEEYDIGVGLLGTWVKKYRAENKLVETVRQPVIQDTPIQGELPFITNEAEIEEVDRDTLVIQLKRRIRELEEENEFLQKAAAYFAASVNQKRIN